MAFTRRYYWVSVRQLLAVVFLLALALPLDAQEFPYGTIDRVQMLKSANTLIEVRSVVDPWTDELYLIATLLDGPFSGTVLRGVAVAPAGHHFGENSRLTAVLETVSGNIVLIAAIPDFDGVRTVRLVGRTHVRNLDADTGVATWPTLAQDLWPTGGSAP